MPQTTTQTKTSTKTIVGVALIGAAIIAAAGAIMLRKPIPILTLETSQPPSSQTVVSGQADVNVYGFTLSASNLGDQVLKEMTFTVIADDDANFLTVQNNVTARDHITSCSLHESSSGALIAGPEPIGTAGELAFDGMSHTLPASQSTKLLVRCNFANVSAQNGDSDIYAVTLPLPSSVVVEEAATGKTISAEKIRLNDRSLRVRKSMGLNPRGSLVNVTVTSGGELSVSLDGGTPSAGIVLGNSTMVPVAKFRFNATGEAFAITHLRLQNCLTQPGGETSACASPSTLGEDTALTSVSISYPNSTGGQSTDVAVLSGNVATFSGVDILVPEDGRAVVDVFANTNLVSTANPGSGDQFQLNLAADDPALTIFEATGLSSGNRISAIDRLGYITANPMTLRKTKPTLTLAVGSPSGGANPGQNEVLRFNVSADSKGDVDWSQVSFSITATDNAGSDWNDCGDSAGAAYLGDSSKWNLYDVTDPSTPVSGSWSLRSQFITCGTDALPVDIAVAGVNETVPAGTTTTYGLSVDTDGASASNNDVIRVGIDAEDPTVGGLPQSFVWSDGVATLIDGMYVKNLPVTGGTIVY